MSTYSSNLDGIARWLVDNGFPFDWTTDVAPPTVLLQRVCKVWAERDGETYADYAASVASDTGWEVPPLAERVG